MDSPLNLAHQQSRKADMMLKVKKYEDAMICHRRAADYLLKALQTTSSELAQESIYHQHQYHLRQQENLQFKLDRQETLKYNKTNTPKVCYSQGVQTDDVVNDEAVRHAISDTDSVLGFLVNRNRTLSDPRSQEYTVKYNPRKHQTLHSITKIPREDKDVIEEMIVKNQELEKQVLQLSKELSDVRAENKALHDHIKMTKTKAKDIFDMEEEACIPDFRLPPLEMPQFDYDSLKDQIEKVTDNPQLFNDD